MNPRKIPSTYRPRSHVNFDASANASGLLPQPPLLPAPSRNQHKGITVAHGNRNSTERSPGFEVPTPHLYAVGSLTERVEMTQAKDILYGRLISMTDRRVLPIHKRCVTGQCHNPTSTV
ncbi:hypothetical protein L208DRAFT_1403895 [Tricholoma matsutake]|nr:hypothetical protein L208DRAFT_1403895 [Tricholoma matsutake 945]